jgi:hypothetical protein
VIFVTPAGTVKGRAAPVNVNTMLPKLEGMDVGINVVVGIIVGILVGVEGN